MLLADAVAERADAHIDVAYRLLTEDLAPLLGPARRDELLDALQVARAGVAGPDLRLVVVGEFSSGKSTLINALLRDTVLPASALETTAVPTEVHAGHRLSVQVRLGPDGRWLDADRDRLLWQPQLPDLAGKDLRSLAAALTADERVAAVRIMHPARALGPGVVIVDTAGVAGHDGRTERTIEVVLTRADLVLVVVPANAAFSRTLVELLTGPLGGHRDRFLFAVTKVDQIDPDERARFLRSVHRSLTVDLQVPACPLIFTAAPAVLPGRRPGGEVDWAAGFRENEDFLRERLVERRPPPPVAGAAGPVADLLCAVAREVHRLRCEVRAAGTRAAGGPGLDVILDRLASLEGAARADTAGMPVAPAVRRQRDVLLAGTAELAYALAAGPPAWPGPYVGAAPNDGRAALPGVADACARYLGAVHRAKRRELADLAARDERLEAWQEDLYRRINLIRPESRGS